MKKLFLMIAFLTIAFQMQATTVICKGQKTGGAGDGSSAICDPTVDAHCATFIVNNGSSDTITRQAFNGTPIPTTGGSGTVQHFDSGNNLLWSGSATSILVTHAGPGDQYVCYTIYHP